MISLQKGFHYGVGCQIGRIERDIYFIKNNYLRIYSNDDFLLYLRNILAENSLKNLSMNILSCVVLEDEEPAQKLLRHYANQIPDMNLLAIFDNAIEATDFLNHTSIDLIITDIEMPRLNGLDFIRMLPSPRPLVVVITAYPNYALEGYELDIVDYIVKPVTLERFKKAIEKAQRFLPNQSKEVQNQPSETIDTIYVKEGGVMVKLEFKDIIYVEGLRDYIKVHTVGRAITLHMTLSKMMEALSLSEFMRVHKSFIINIDKITSIDSANSLVVLNNKAQITLGRAYKQDFIAKFKSIN
jgi:DNA-binding LytR/AlgR family response regulator